MTLWRQRLSTQSYTAPLVAGGLLDAAWSPDQLYLGYGMAFVLAAVIVSMHRIAGPQAELTGFRFAARHGQGHAETDLAAIRTRSEKYLSLIMVKKDRE